MAQVDNVKPPRPIWPQRPSDNIKDKKDQAGQGKRQKDTPSNDDDDGKDGNSVDEYA